MHCSTYAGCATRPSAVRVVATPGLPNKATTATLFAAVAFFLLLNEALASALAEAIHARTLGVVVVVHVDATVGRAWAGASSA
jgi:hypothetical protein